MYGGSNTGNGISSYCFGVCCLLCASEKFGKKKTDAIQIFDSARQKAATTIGDDTLLAS